ncbi:hypothetical protein MAPG_08842 [Magnaporthiopsis poae ATCC 64411]|uniref:Uncharacterized protein n=1 Tax=Magnaporthiopsis poae (strain ATCC 64411 / 73-15) TaxID=644358 RepID=A0A0C4E8E1_MAGP6|nr:hypothetical protein MAPG_08842 [Magnaporthiopsis poae ATCC 64411]
MPSRATFSGRHHLLVLPVDAASGLDVRLLFHGARGALTHADRTTDGKAGSAATTQGIAVDSTTQIHGNELLPQDE